jgi:hypothetical protein
MSPKPIKAFIEPNGSALINQHAWLKGGETLEINVRAKFVLLEPSDLQCTNL